MTTHDNHDNEPYNGGYTDADGNFVCDLCGDFPYMLRCENAMLHPGAPTQAEIDAAHAAEDAAIDAIWDEFANARS